MVYKAMDVARMVIALTDEEHGGLINNLRLQKLLYYQQGYWLAEYNEPLFDAEVQAWGYGPVVPEVYEHFKPYGRTPIPVGREGATIAFESAEREELFFNVFNTFSQFSASALVRMSHDTAPWQNAWAYGAGTPISQSSMRRFFVTQFAD